MKRIYLVLATALLFANIVSAQIADSLRRKHIQDSLSGLKAHETEYSSLFRL